MNRRLLYLLAAAGLAGLIPLAGMSLSRRPVLRVAAASDLQRAFRELEPLFEAESGAELTLILGSTGLLSKQVENGAPYDVFAAANESYVEDLEAKGKILPGTRASYAVGRLVIWTAPGKPRADSLKDLAHSQFRRVAIANPQHAPYGRAAQEALTNAGLWKTIEPKLVYGENVLQAMQYARSGGADAAVVALSLSVGTGGSSALVPESLYSPLRQALGVTAQTRNADLARRFARFVNGAMGRPVMRKYGFALPGEPRP